MNNQAIYYFHQGTNYNLYDYLGSHFISQNGKKGIVFRVWAPNAQSVSVVGDFNKWDVEKNYLTRLDDGEIFELFIPNLKQYDNYKYAIKSNNKVVLKSDPFAFHSETTPSNASKIYSLDNYYWGDSTYFKNLTKKDYLNSPINIYEINLCSWKKKPDGNYYSYLEYSNELVSYCLDMGYNYVEFMPLSEFPFDGSWGYQVTGYYSITSRFGTPKDFMLLVDKLHQNNIGVILDWVPAHFPKDENGLYEFDGSPLYEYNDISKQEHKSWGTRIFDFGKKEVQSFLISNAVFLFEKFHIDGIRVDAVASMLYLDYDRRPGEWSPNIYGENKNLEAIEFFHKLNCAVYERFSYALMIAEESTANIQITGKIENGALGFLYKWNMGWMNDILSYMKTDPYFRKYQHNKLTFSMMYSFSENFILPISHDEVVHGKCSLLNKMPGNYEDKFANNRAFLGFMMSHPGKKLTFMGEEFGQYKEWNYKEGLEFFLKDYPMHNKLSLFYKDLNHFYLNNEALFSIDNSWKGFEWIDVDNADNNIISYLRKGKNQQIILIIISFNGIDLNTYRVFVPKGKYRVVFNSDLVKYGGEGKNKKNIYTTKKIKIENKNYIDIYLSKLSFLYLEKIL